MALVASQSSNNQVITLGAGTHVGHVLMTHHGCTIRGAGIDATTIKADGTYAYLFQRGATVDGEPVSSLTIEDLTLDADNRSDLVAMIASQAAPYGPLQVYLRRVRFRNHHRNTSAVIDDGRMEIEDCEIVGNGGGLTTGLASTQTLVRGLSIVGCMYGYQVADDFTVGVVQGIDIQDLTVDHLWYHSPTYESVTVTAFGALFADVASHTVAHRGLYDCLRVLTPLGTFTVAGATAALPAALERDRVELADGRWTQVLGVFNGIARLDTWRAAGSFNPVAIPTGELATAYSMTLGRTFGWTSTRLQLATDEGVPKGARWRRVDGETAATPSVVAGVRLDILRHGYTGVGPRDVDTGAVHVTRTALNPRLRRLRLFRTFSDTCSTRAPGCVVEDSLFEESQDMCSTTDGEHGRQTYRNVIARKAGNNGWLCANGPTDFFGCVAELNGQHRDGVFGVGYGVYVTAESWIQVPVLGVRGEGNIRELVGGGPIAYGGSARQLLELARLRGRP